MVSRTRGSPADAPATTPGCPDTARACCRARRCPCRARSSRQCERPGCLRAVRLRSGTDPPGRAVRLAVGGRQLGSPNTCALFRRSRADVHIAPAPASLAGQPRGIRPAEPESLAGLPHAVEHAGRGPDGARHRVLLAGPPGSARVPDGAARRLHCRTQGLELAPQALAELGLFERVGRQTPRSKRSPRAAAFQSRVRTRCQSWRGSAQTRGEVASCRNPGDA